MFERFHLAFTVVRLKIQGIIVFVLILLLRLFLIVLTVAAVPTFLFFLFKDVLIKDVHQGGLFVFLFVAGTVLWLTICWGLFATFFDEHQLRLHDMFFYRQAFQVKRDFEKQWPLREKTLGFFAEDAEDIPVRKLRELFQTPEFADIPPLRGLLTTALCQVEQRQSGFSRALPAVYNDDGLAALPQAIAGLQALIDSLKELITAASRLPPFWRNCLFPLFNRRGKNMIRELRKELNAITHYLHQYNQQIAQKNDLLKRQVTAAEKQSQAQAQQVENAARQQEQRRQQEVRRQKQEAEQARRRQEIEAAQAAARRQELALQESAQQAAARAAQEQEKLTRQKLDVKLAQEQAEQTRAEAERQRQEAEALKARAELTQAEAEKARVEAEKARVEADQAALTKFSDAASLPLSYYFDFLKHKLDAATWEELAGHNHASLLALYEALKDVFQRHQLIPPERLEHIAPQVKRLDEIETLIDLYSEKIRRVKEDASLDPDEQQMKIDYWLRLRDRDIAELEK